MLVSRSVVRLSLAPVEWRLVFRGPVRQSVAGLGPADFFKLRTLEADSGKAAVGGEDDVAAGVVPGVVFVDLEDGEANAVDGS